ncbi:hypothetical protein GCM10023321_53390 [Pseudonocardia eucalypti]|uniref:ABC transporter substrate-binding protein n=1 Tax=Pseudonocardia eucalypti TaxID=648755 RepID=A0ABP9QNB5_9PSEU|nr:NitT/TauT family transport system substrate-binding protein [Pseudonocardia eucalypti]
MVFRVQPHVRLHEWVAEELDLFRAEGLDYEFQADGFAGGTAATVASASSAPLQVRSGAFEDMAAGRESDVSCACHWAVNAASSSLHGKMYGSAYSVCPSSIFVAADSPYREPADLAGVEVGVGYHSGSHYSALQALEPFLRREQIRLGFIGRPFDRARQLLAGTVPAVNVWGAPAYLLEQLGYRKLVDTTFVMGYLLSERAEPADVRRYFRALRRAQREIDLEPHRHTRHWAREMPADLLKLVDVRRFGPGERVVDAPYTRDMFERTQGWMREWDLLDGTGRSLARYEESVLS